MTLQNITNKQQGIPKLLYRFRFLNSNHIQQFLHYSNRPDSNELLKDLTIKEYIRRMYDDKIIGKNRVPAVYSLKRNGVRLLKQLGIGDDAVLHKLYYEEKRTDSFIGHCLLIATICCQLDKKESDILSYEYTTQADLAAPDNPFHFLKDSGLVVDLCFSKKQKGRKKQYYLLTIFDGTLPKYRIRKRIKDYYQFYFYNEWENSIDVPFPKIILIFPTLQLLIYAKRLTKTLLEQDEEVGLSFYFALAEDVKKFGITGEIWETI